MRYTPPTSWLGPTRRPPTSGEVLRGVELFASGHYRGKDYTVADLEQMASNFDRLGPKGLKLLDPPAALGHEETQAYLERTDLPAAGWVRRLTLKKYHEKATGKTEAVLVGDIVGVPKSIANRIRSGQYRKVSAEVYSDFTDDFGRTYGKALRRVAFLGAEVPQVKRIADLPMPEPSGNGLSRYKCPKCGGSNAWNGIPGTDTRFRGGGKCQDCEGTFSIVGSGMKPIGEESFAEPRPTRLRPRESATRFAGTKNESVVCFSEVVSMADGTAPTRQDRVEAILAAMPSLAMPTLDGMTDDQLADLAKNLPPVAPAQPNPGPGGMPAMNPMTPAPMPGAMPPGADMMGDLSREEMIAELAAAGQDPAALQSLPDAELKNLLAQAGQGGVTALADGEGLSVEEMIAELIDLGQDPDELAGMPEAELKALYAELTTGDPPAEEAAAMSERRRSMGRANRYATMSERVNRSNYVQSLRQHAAIKRQDAEAFCERLHVQGRMLPAQRDIFLGYLLSKDNLTPAVKFNEGGRVTQITAYEAEKKKLAAMPVVVRFAERVEAGRKADAKTRGPDREVRIVRRFAEANATSLRGGGLTPDQFVEKFSEQVKKKPTLTAAELIGPAAKDYDRDDDE